MTRENSGLEGLTFIFDKGEISLVSGGNLDLSPLVSTQMAVDLAIEVIYFLKYKIQEGGIQYEKPNLEPIFLDLAKPDPLGNSRSIKVGRYRKAPRFSEKWENFLDEVFGLLLNLSRSLKNQWEFDDDPEFLNAESYDVIFHEIAMELNHIEEIRLLEQNYQQKISHLEGLFVYYLHKLTHEELKNKALLEKIKGYKGHLKTISKPKLKQGRRNHSDGFHGRRKDGHNHQDQIDVLADFLRKLFRQR